MPESSGNSFSLPALSLRELRLLASRLGLGRYAALTRDSLIAAIRGRIGPSPVTPAVVETPVLSEPQSEALPEVLPQPSESEAPPSRPSWVVFSPQSDRWAEVRWQINDGDRETALAAGATDLCLRLGDVTGLAEGDALPHAIQEVVVDSSGSQWYLPIPVGGRSYRVELGFRTAEAGGWISLATSAGAPVPASMLEPSTATAPLPFLLTAPAAAGFTAPAPIAASGLHERLYQAAASGRQRLGLGSEAFQEHDSSAFAGGGAGQQASGEGFWASGIQESGAGGVAARKRRFWLVADAELIVHAATEPSALLTIGGSPHPLSEEGTIRVHVPFPDGEQHYPIAAVAADGEQKRHVTLSFRRGTPEARVNRREDAVDEWF
jgi:uncharacterized protein